MAVSDVIISETEPEPPNALKAWSWRVFKWGLCLLVLVFVARKAWQLWQQEDWTGVRFNWSWLVLAGLAYLAHRWEPDNAARALSLEDDSLAIQFPGRCRRLALNGTATEQEEHRMAIVDSVDVDRLIFLLDEGEAAIERHRYG